MEKIKTYSNPPENSGKSLVTCLAIPGMHIQRGRLVRFDLRIHRLPESWWGLSRECGQCPVRQATNVGRFIGISWLLTQWRWGYERTYFFWGVINAWISCDNSPAWNVLISGHTLHQSGHCHLMSASHLIQLLRNICTHQRLKRMVYDGIFHGILEIFHS